MGACAFVGADAAVGRRRGAGRRYSGGARLSSASHDACRYRNSIACSHPGVVSPAEGTPAGGLATLVDRKSRYTIIVKSEQYPQASRLRVNMGNIYFEQKKYDQASKNYNMAIDSTTQ